jgi:hypothetical protein
MPFLGSSALQSPLVEMQFVDRLAKWVSLRLPPCVALSQASRFALPSFILEEHDLSPVPELWLDPLNKLLEALLL